MAPTAAPMSTASPASTALSVVLDPAPAAPDAPADIDKLSVVEPVAEMSGGLDPPRPPPDSLPVVRITEPPVSPAVTPARTSTQTNNLPHSPAPQRTNPATTAPAASPNQDRSRRDVRASNRLSGFFSQLLTPRRHDGIPPVPQAGTRDRSVSPPGSPVVQNFAPPPRPPTPPPALPSPTLVELGLSLSVITPALTGAQYATPPTNGTFLAPHYLLLCHTHGLDVLPLVGSPSPQPYALVRRVTFKSVIVMEERGVLVAIAGRRDGVRVYALEEVRRAVEWRLELEVRREAESTRRSRELTLKGKNRVSIRPTLPGVTIPASSSAPSALGSSQQTTVALKPVVQTPISPPPSYASAFEHRPLITRVSTTNLAAAANAQSRARGASLSSVIGLGTQGSIHSLARGGNGREKSDWGDAHDSDEALVAAGPEASAALDERTSAGGQAQASAQITSVASAPLQIGGAGRRATVSNGADTGLGATLSSLRQTLTHSRSTNLFPRSPTLHHSDLPVVTGASDDVSFTQMLQESRLPPPDVAPNSPVRRASVVMLRSQSHPVVAGDELGQVNESTDHQPDAPTDDQSRPRRWSSAAPPLVPESREQTRPPTPNEQRPTTVPALPTPPSVVQRPLMPPSPRPGSHRSTQSHPSPNLRPITPPVVPAGHSRRRLLPKLFGAFGVKKNRSRSQDPGGVGVNGNGSGEALAKAGPGMNGDTGAVAGIAAAPKLEYIKLPGTKGAIMIKAVETAKKSFLAILCGESGEKVELFAGTYRTALSLSRTFILPDSPKSLELQLQGDDLVEVFLVFAQHVFGLEPATVRVREVRIGRNERRAARRRARAGAGPSEAGTTPRPTEIEPTVVTTVVSADGDPAPINRSASRRSRSITRRRREVSGRVTHDPNNDVPPPVPSASNPPTPSNTDPVLAEEMATLAVAQSGAYTTFQQLSFAPAFPLASIADDYVIPPTYLSFLEYRDEWEPDAERVVAAPRNIEDEPQYVVVKGGRKDKVKGRESTLDSDQDSPGASGSGLRRDDSLEDDPAHALQFEAQPPVPTVIKWFYLDPKGVVQGPWKSSIMQNWLREGYLPPELPVRRAHETEYTLLRDLRTQVDDPLDPFKPAAQCPPSPAPAPAPESEPELEPEPTPETIPQTTEPEEITTTIQVIPSATTSQPAVDPTPPFGPTKALLKPISLLAQPRHFGPPALFYCSRAGHSTTIVDARGRAVLKGRIHWSTDCNMGDTQRIEAFDVEGRAVFVALRQGGIEATDVGQALLDPADESRTALPNYKVSSGAISRRGPFVWRLGTAVNSAGRPVGSSDGKRRTATHGRKRGVPKANGSNSLEIQRNDSEDEPESHNTSDEEVIFLAREQDNVYICERSAGKFRILRLSRTSPSP